METKPQFIDIGANLTDESFRGHYNGKQYHPDDFEAVLGRAWEAGVERVMVTAGRLQEVKEALQLVDKHDRLYTTVGVHPTRCDEFEAWEGGAEDYLQQLLALALPEGKPHPKIVAVGEFGLDYDRLQFCSKETQLKYFEAQFELVEKTGLPLFLHMRNACDDFIEVVKRNRHKFSNGVVHSFTGTMEEMQALVALDLFIGINGCSLKTKENLDVVCAIPEDRIMIETDAPYCDIRNTHAGAKLVSTKWPSVDRKKHDTNKMVKGRNEPCAVRQVMEVVAGARGVGLEELAAKIHTNTRRVFFP